MFSKIAVALNDLPESQRALRTGIDLARLCKAELATISILEDLPAFAAFSVVADPGVHAQGSIVVGNEVRAILHFLKEQHADLLVVGLHQHDFYLSRLWNSVYDLAQEATCSVLGVH
jgi:nucleotide-binding universal stress UspA family protein